MERNRLGIVRTHLSPDLLLSAYNFSQMASDVEAQGKSVNEITKIKYRSFVIASILSAVGFLEATINELYYVASDKVLESSRITDKQRNCLSPIWTIGKFRKGANILEKYQTALLLLGNVPFDEGKNPYQNARLSIDLRNALVHYVPETTEVTLEQYKDQVGYLEKKLKGKFETSPFLGDFPVIVTAQPNKRAKYPFFPHRCLSCGCSEWVSRSCLSFANAFFQLINVKWHYHDYLQELPNLRRAKIAK
jgi:hypothetical protein